MPDPATAAPRAPAADGPQADGPHTRLAVRALAAATLAVGAAYAAALAAGAAPAPAWTAWAMAAGVPTALAAMMTLGAARRGRVAGRLLAAFAGVGALLALAFALALALPEGAGGGALGEPLLLGLPRRAAVVVYGVGLLPVFVLPVIYALTFDAQTLRAEDLARVRALGAERDARPSVVPGAAGDLPSEVCDVVRRDAPAPDDESRHPQARSLAALGMTAEGDRP